MRTYLFLTLLLLCNIISAQGFQIADDFKDIYYRQSDSALRYMDSLIIVNPNKAAFIKRGDIYFNRYNTESYQAAYSDYSEAIKLSTDSLAQLLLRRGHAAQRFNDELAFKDYAESIELDSLAGGYGVRASFLTFRKRFEEAIADYDKQIAISGDSISAIYEYSLWRGFAKYKIGKCKEALTDLNNVVKYVENNGIAHSYIARVKRDMGQTYEACEDYKRAVYEGLYEFEELVFKYCK